MARMTAGKAMKEKAYEKKYWLFLISATSKDPFLGRGGIRSVRSTNLPNNRWSNSSTFSGWTPASGRPSAWVAFADLRDFGKALEAIASNVALSTSVSSMLDSLESLIVKMDLSSECTSPRRLACSGDAVIVQPAPTRVFIKHPLRRWPKATL